MKKTTFVCPSWGRRGLTSVRVFRMPPLGLLQLASLTPLEWEVEIVDENVQRLDFDAPTDLVALTAMTALAPAAYRIADEYRLRGVPTIMGGIHASLLPEEALQHVDSVVIGEADEIWPDVLTDFASGNPRKIYQAERRPDLTTLHLVKGVPRYAGYPLAKVPLIQTSRGCPLDCDFCSVSSFNGRRIRHRSIEEVVEEVQRWTNSQSIFSRYVIFADDNIVADAEYAVRLFKALIPLGIRWLSQTDIRIALDRELLELAVASGCCTVFIGFESIDEESLAEEISKTKAHWRGSYEEAIQRLVETGVGIQGAFVFGLDSHGSVVFERTVGWAIQNRIGAVQFTVLTPFPGTRLFERLEREDRITARNENGSYRWEKFNAFEVVIQPACMSAEELQNGLLWAYKAFYSYGSMRQRLPHALRNTSRFEVLLAGLVNLNFHHSFRV